MNSRTLNSVRATYADVLDHEEDHELLPLLRDLDAGYRTIDPPAWLRNCPPRPQKERARRRSTWRRRLFTIRVQALSGLTIVLVAILVIVATQVSIAGNDITKLGPPGNETVFNPNFPLSGFHRVSTSLRSGRLPELLWIGTAWPGDPNSDIERWPVMKALDQFGTWGNILAAQPGCGTPEPRGDSRQVSLVTPCSLPTFDWSHARFKSKHVGFVHKDLLDAHGHLFQRLSGTEQNLFDRYVRRVRGSTPQAVGASIYSDQTMSTGGTHDFPLIAVGGYLQTETQVPFGGDFAPISVPQTGPSPADPHPNAIPFSYYFGYFTFSQVQAALSSGKPLAAGSTLIPDVNAEANVITALMCHVDGSKPSSVCGRPVIKQLLKHVK